MSGPARGEGGDALLAELDERARAIAAADPASAGPLWGAVHKLLLKTRADKKDAMRLVATRDAAGLARLVAALRGAPAAPEAAAPDVGCAEAAAPGSSSVSPETMKKAMRAFRRRLKLTRLDHESKLGVGPMTGGRTADFDAILPPREFPPEVWDALVAAGQLKSAGQGFFMLAE